MNDQQKLLPQAIEALREGDLAQAEALGRQCLQENSRNVNALELMATIAYRKRDLATCVSTLREAVGIAPERLSTLMDLGVAYLETGDSQNSLRCFEKAMQLDPDSRKAVRGAEAAAKLGRKRIPGIHLNTLPKSGSMFICDALADGLAIEKTVVSCGYFPDDMILRLTFEQLSDGGFISQSHLPANRLNKVVLQDYVDRIVVHVRDPRQALLSWTHFLTKLERDGRPEVNHTIPPLPSEYFSLSLAEQIGWQIENYLPLCVQWLEGWIDASEDEAFRVKILFTRFEDFVADADSFFMRILDFYGIPESLFVYQKRPKEGADHFRKGRVDEWREVFDADQTARATAIMTERILTQFGWER